MRLKRLGVITVVMAMVLSLAGLASADEASTTTEIATVAPEQGSEGFLLYDDPAADPLVGLLEFVLYWGFDEFENPDTERPCYVAPLVSAADTTSSTTLPTVCLDVSGPNGQVNHGQFVSAFVHWLKTELANEEGLLSEYGGKKGNLIKQAAKSDFGKGQWKKDHGIIPTVDTTEALEAADTDGDGPNHAYGHAKNKNK